MFTVVTHDIPKPPTPGGLHMFEDSETVHLQASRCPSNNEPVSKNHYREIMYVT